VINNGSDFFLWCGSDRLIVPGSTIVPWTAFPVPRTVDPDSRSGSCISNGSGYGFGSNPDPGFWWPESEEKNTAVWRIGFYSAKYGTRLGTQNNVHIFIVTGWQICQLLIPGFLPRCSYILGCHSRNFFISFFLDQKLQFTHVQTTGKASSPQKRTSSTSKNEIY
jgi:hypothetical protein